MQLIFDCFHNGCDMFRCIPTTTADYFRSQIHIFPCINRHVFGSHIVHTLLCLNIHVGHTCIRLDPQREIRHGVSIFLDHKFHIGQCVSAVCTHECCTHLGIFLHHVFWFHAH